MPKKSKLSPDDINTFSEAVKGVKPLIYNKTQLVPSVSRHRRVLRPSIKETALNLSESQDLPTVSGEEFISYKQPDVSNKTLRKLRKGQYNVDAILDLHGMIIEEAKTAVNHFLQQCMHKEIRVALIIHGKGLHSDRPILKNKLNHWLRSTPVVLAFCSASPGHGSRGALYVLLKVSTEESRR